MALQINGTCCVISEHSMFMFFQYAAAIKDSVNSERKTMYFVIFLHDFRPICYLIELIEMYDLCVQSKEKEREREEKETTAKLIIISTEVDGTFSCLICNTFIIFIAKQMKINKISNTCAAFEIVVINIAIESNLKIIVLMSVFHKFSRDVDF